MNLADFFEPQDSASKSKSKASVSQGKNRAGSLESSAAAEKKTGKSSKQKSVQIDDAPEFFEPTSSRRKVRDIPEGDFGYRSDSHHLSFHVRLTNRGRTKLHHQNSSKKKKRKTPHCTVSARSLSARMAAP